MSDDYQIEIPPSFQALYVDARKRLTVPLAEYRARYELCEDLAQQLTDIARDIHWRLDLPEAEVLTRCQQGLLGDDAQVSGDEARWVIRRLAELLGWEGSWGSPQDFAAPPA